MANPDKDGFTLVKGGRQSKKRKADGSPLLHSPPGASSASPINTPARPRPSTHKNSVPIILSDVDPKFNSVVKLMSDLRQFHPSPPKSQGFKGPGTQKQQVSSHWRHPTRRCHSPKGQQNEGLSRPKFIGKFTQSLPNC